MLGVLFLVFCLASASYQAVIEATKSNLDFLWQGSAMEGLYSAVVLLAYIQADLSVSAADFFRQHHDV